LEWLDAPRGNEPKECCNFGNKLLYVGNLNYTKGVDILIRAITLLPEDRQVQLTIVGEGQMRSELEKLCVNLRLTDRIQFVGAVQHSEISQWMSRSNLLVIPSRSEGFGMVAVEAMASGLPVAATNIGGLREIITPETGVLADSVTPSDIALAILTALDKHWDRNIIRKSACKYDWSLVTRLIENIYSFVTKET
jgi:glycosyltransferase involved in cell wall biosynthesis